MARYLVTGAAGFIASRVAEMLLTDGHEVVGVDEMNDAYDVRMKEYRLARLTDREGFRFFCEDIGDREAVARVWRETGAAGRPFDAIVNLAARAGVRVSLEDPWVYMHTNLTGTLNLLEAARNHGTKKFVLASTSSVYGKEAPLPTPETADTDRPLQPYSASKKAAEALCFSYHYLYGIDVTVVRYFTVYGPAARPDMSMFRFARWIREGEPVQVNGDGEQTRGFTHLDDIAAGTILALKPVGYEIVNLGGHESISINGLIRMIEEKTGRTATVEHGPFHPADMRANQADVTKAKALLGWEPKVGLEDGVGRLVEWYEAEREFASRLII